MQLCGISNNMNGKNKKWNSWHWCLYHNNTATHPALSESFSNRKQNDCHSTPSLLTMLSSKQLKMALNLSSRDLQDLAGQSSFHFKWPYLCLLISKVNFTHFLKLKISKIRSTLLRMDASYHSQSG
jgi:hypothetical protein